MRFIMRASPDADVDLYVEWSTATDSPLRWGPRADFGDVDSDHLDRADEFGTSARFAAEGSVHHEGGYLDVGVIVGNLPHPDDRGFVGFLPRHRLHAFLVRLTRDEPASDLCNAVRQ